MRRYYEPNRLLDTSHDGQSLIMRAESFMARWYPCPAGIWTIGYGTTESSLRGVTRAQLPGPIDEPFGRALLQRGLAEIYEPGIESRVRVPLTQNQFDALVSFVYNVGVGAFERSTLLRLINGEDFEHAAFQFDRWVFAAGRVMPGLVKRRAAERALFERQLTPGLVAQIEPLPVLPVQEIPASILPPTPRPLHT